MCSMSRSECMYVGWLLNLAARRALESARLGVRDRQGDVSCQAINCPTSSKLLQQGVGCLPPSIARLIVPSACLDSGGGNSLVPWGNAGKPLDSICTGPPRAAGSNCGFPSGDMWRRYDWLIFIQGRFHLLGARTGVPHEYVCQM